MSALDLLRFDILPDRAPIDDRARPLLQERQRERIDAMAVRIHAQLGPDRPRRLSYRTIVTASASWTTQPRLGEHLQLCRAYDRLHGS